MTQYYNILGSSTVAGSTAQDRFFAFTYDTNFDHVRADMTIASFVWTSSIRTSANAFYTFTGTNIQVSSDFFSGLEGTDVVYGSNLNDAILYNNGVISGGIGSFSSIEQIEMGAGDDFIDLSAHGANGIDYAKNIIIHGDAGNDTIIGGAGMDTIDGGDGNDTLIGYRGADTITGGTGNDVIYGDDLGFNNIGGEDVLYGQAGDDTLYGGARFDTLDGGDGNDTLYGGLGGDTLLGGNGNDILIADDPGTAANDLLNGGAGDDQLFGGGGNDEMRGGTGNDMLDGGDGTDALFGDAGADTLIGGAGNDTIDGAADIDTVVYTGSSNDYAFVLNADGSVTITDTRAGSPDGTDTVRNVEFFQFSDKTVDSGHLNQPPTITSDGGGASAALSIEENTSAVTTVTAIDPDTGQTIAYSISGGADAALFTIDPATGALSFNSAPNFENPVDTGRDNVYDVVVRATDNNGGFDDQALAVTVTDVIDGFSPVITSNGGGATASVQIDENSAAVTVVQATDEDSPTVSYTILGGADAALFQIDALTGQLTFVAPPDFEAPGDANHDNVYDVIVQASDGVNTDNQAISVTVGNLNDNSPVITSGGGTGTATASAAENQTAVTTVTASDADGGNLVFSIVGGADEALFSIDPQTGVLVFNAAPDFELPSDANADNVYDIVVRASDGTNVGQQNLSVTVTNVSDSPPVITSDGGGATASVNVAENTVAVTTVAAVDPDGTAPAYVIVGGADAALFSIDVQTGALKFIAAADFEAPGDADQNGVYDVVVRATDGTYFDDQALAVTVTNVPDNPPVITSNGGGATASLSIAENGTAVTTVAATDADGTTPTYVISGGADAALFTIDAQTGALTFRAAPDFETPLDADHNGVYDVIVRATDGTFFDDQQLAVTVTDVNETGRTITGTSGNNTISPTATNLALQTTALNDTIFALAGNDTIDGGLGADRMEGGTGNDTYFVGQFSDDGISANDDIVVEQLNEGTDLVNASVSYILTANVENLTLTGSAAINGTGNDLDNVITGNDAVNVLNGGIGNDTLFGMGGNDTLFGGAGADRLDGGTGADILNGGADNDTYVVDTFSNDGISSNDDQVIELSGGGVDIVNASVSYILVDEVENLTLTGATAIDGTGNVLANILTGNAAANTLSGLDGDDTINGNAGDDILFGGNGNDTLNGGSENDTLNGDAGNDTLLGGAGNDTLQGGAGTDTLSGQAGNDLLIGGLGKDTLTGGTEADTFRFNFGDTTVVSTSYDNITDFTTGIDKIDIDSVLAPLTSANYAESAITTNLFADASSRAASLMAGKDAVFVAGTTDGWLFWDTNHDGQFDQTILLKGLGSLSAFDAGDVI
ncbi:beta strand repeat-containing protein [Novosphingobium lentum]|uniref:beta strand repeat-containing protein n=1 Tax=Novosphingobium lentum TaxID=145287 RepID=UPI0008363A5E|nr:cadherin domain-containing protein [Novosphingobium lentum]